MVVSYQGGESFKVSQGDLALAVNPKSRAGAAITLLSKLDTEASVAKDSFVIDGPGEYEVKGVSIKGFASGVYIVNFENVNLCFLSNKVDESLPESTTEAMDDVDILFTPVSRYKLAVSLAPKVIIPMDYTPESLKKFLKESGAETTEVDKLVIKKKDLEGKEGDIIILKEE